MQIILSIFLSDVSHVDPIMWYKFLEMILGKYEINKNIHNATKLLGVWNPIECVMDKSEK